MIIFKNQDSDFLNKFYDILEEWTYLFYHQINHSFLHDNGFYKKNFTHDEITAIILLNKNVFQSLAGYFKLIEVSLLLPAFSSLRVAIESKRILRLFYLDDKFRNDYLNNSNFEFDTIIDSDFTQGKICKRLEELKELKISHYNHDNLIEDNRRLTKGSAISNVHSELSKWSHSMNIILITLHQIDNIEKRIYLGVDDELTFTSESFIRKYTEVVYVLLFEHLKIFTHIDFDEKNIEKFEKLTDLYDEFVHKFYK